MLRFLVALFAAMLSWEAAAQAFPVRPVRIVVGFPPGGSDVSLRLLTPKLTELWGQPVIIDNRPGAAGNLGADIVAKAAPDGYTLLLCVNSYTINTTVYRNLSWDLLRDFAPVGRYASSPMAVVVNDKVPVKNLSQLIALAKANPDKLNYSSTGSGTAPHLGTELFLIQTGIQIMHVPFKGGAAAVQAVLAGDTQVSFATTSSVLPFVQAGRLRALAVTSLKRSSELPDVPTVSEAGISGFDVDIWYGLIAPAKTPAAVVKKISEDLGRILADPDTQSKLRQRGLEPAYLDPGQTGELMRRDVTRWRDVANRVNLSLD